MEHYHDMSEAPDAINEKIIRFSKQFMIILKKVYKWTEPNFLDI